MDTTTAQSSFAPGSLVWLVAMHEELSRFQTFAHSEVTTESALSLWIAAPCPSEQVRGCPNPG